MIGAATGVILSAVYALNVYRRVMFGELTNPALAAINDLDLREGVFLFAPLIICTLGLGLQPNLVLGVTQAASEHLVSVYQAARGH